MIIRKFYADWCNPCKQMTPIIEEVANALPTVSVENINIEDEENAQLVENSSIRSIPSFEFVTDEGEVAHKHTGRLTKDELIKILADNGV